MHYRAIQIWETILEVLKRERESYTSMYLGVIKHGDTVCNAL